MRDCVVFPTDSYVGVASTRESRPAAEPLLQVSGAGVRWRPFACLKEDF
jgi:hypothetical protein